MRVVMYYFQASVDLTQSYMLSWHIAATLRASFDNLLGDERLHGAEAAIPLEVIIDEPVPNSHSN